jgi:alpha-tubulin suppressor-like RCC1 family protein
MPDQDFEQRFAKSLSDYAEEGVQPFDAVEIAHLAATARGGAAAAVARQRQAAPAWIRSLVLAGLLVLMLIALAFAGGFVRLPTGLLEPSHTPAATIGDVTPHPSATLGPQDPPLPTFIAGLTPSPGPSPTVAPPSIPGPSLPATLEPTVAPTIPATPEPTIEPTSGPPTAEPSVRIIAVEAGEDHACGIRADRSIACWGHNGKGELGNGTVDENFIFPAVTVAGIDDAVAVATGIRYSCAVTSNGRVWCWGEGGFGQLGNSAENDSSTPVRVSGIDDAIDVTTGGGQACALRSNGRIACWGIGQSGQLGNGVMYVSTVGSSTPVAVSDIADAVAISSGWNHTCALRPDRTVWCWGRNGAGSEQRYGAIGDGTLEDRSTPVQVVGIDNATSISMGGWSSCALLADRSVMCWGYGERGGLGNGDNSNSPVPVQVSGLDDAVQVSVGGWHACALRPNDRIACWGANSLGSGYGQLGSGDREDHNVPVPVVGVNDATRIGAAGFSTCAIRAGGSVWCWGPGGGSEEPWQIPIPPTEGLAPPAIGRRGQTHEGRSRS